MTISLLFIVLSGLKIRLQIKVCDGFGTFYMVMATLEFLRWCFSIIQARTKEKLLTLNLLLL